MPAPHDEDDLDDERDADEEVGEDDVEDVDSAPDALDEKASRHDALLDEGVEETFPASDPVAVKHIT